MPELPEVEVLVRHLASRVRGKTIRAVEVRRGKVIRPATARQFHRALRGARFLRVERRAKYLLFALRAPHRGRAFTLLGHLGMTGRMFLAPKRQPLPKHTAVVLDLGRVRLIYEDTRYFGRLTLDTAPLAQLGPEPFGTNFTAAYFSRALRRSGQAVKVKLLDQTLVAGIGNIYACEALHAAGISPRRAARRLTRAEVTRLCRAIRRVLAAAIRFGSTVPLRFDGGDGDGLFYYGRDPDAPDYYAERLRVYDRAGQACRRCGGVIRRLLQAGRGTYWCPGCQR